MKEVGWCEAQNKTADRKTGKVDFCWFFFACQQKSGFVFCLENGQQRGGRKKGEKDDFLLPLTPPPPTPTLSDTEEKWASGCKRLQL